MFFTPFVCGGSVVLMTINHSHQQKAFLQFSYQMKAWEKLIGNSPGLGKLFVSRLKLSPAGRETGNSLRRKNYMEYHKSHLPREFFLLIFVLFLFNDTQFHFLLAEGKEPNPQKGQDHIPLLFLICFLLLSWKLCNELMTLLFLKKKKRER